MVTPYVVKKYIHSSKFSGFQLEHFFVSSHNQDKPSCKVKKHLITENTKWPVHQKWRLVFTSNPTTVCSSEYKITCNYKLLKGAKCKPIAVFQEGVSRICCFSNKKGRNGHDFWNILPTKDGITKIYTHYRDWHSVTSSYESIFHFLRLVSEMNIKYVQIYNTVERFVLSCDRSLVYAIADSALP